MKKANHFSIGFKDAIPEGLLLTTLQFLETMEKRPCLFVEMRTSFQQLKVQGTFNHQEKLTFQPLTKTLYASIKSFADFKSLQKLNTYSIELDFFDNFEGLQRYVVLTGEIEVG
jgi:hypothetical protein